MLCSYEIRALLTFFLNTGRNGIDNNSPLSSFANAHKVHGPDSTVDYANLKQTGSVQNCKKYTIKMIFFMDMLDFCYYCETVILGFLPSTGRT